MGRIHFTQSNQASRKAMKNRKKVRIASGVARAAIARNSAGVMKQKKDRRSKDARNHWSKDLNN